MLAWTPRHAPPHASAHVLLFADSLANSDLNACAARSKATSHSAHRLGTSQTKRALLVARCQRRQGASYCPERLHTWSAPSRTSWRQAITGWCMPQWTLARSPTRALSLPSTTARLAPVTDIAPICKLEQRTPHSKPDQHVVGEH